MRNQNIDPTMTMMNKMQNRMMMLQVFVLVAMVSGLIYLGHIFPHVAVLFYGAAVVISVMYVGSMLMFLSMRKNMNRMF